ncbi:MAG TPA: hypothetical protein VMF67_06020 [Rhizomicrobium sp.]|nr:hypothetical protein [Rhizomicrobium sp.]
MRRFDDDESVVLSRKVRAHARPRPIFGFGDQACPDGVETHIARAGDKAGVVHHHRAEAILEEVSAKPRPRVNVVGVTPVRLADGTGKSVVVSRHGDQMDMVGHQAVRRYLHFRLFRLLRQKVAVNHMDRRFRRRSARGDCRER